MANICSGLLNNIEYMPGDFFFHQTAVIDPGCVIGEGSKIWHFSHVMSSARIGRNCNIGQNVFVADGVILGDNVKIQNNVSCYQRIICEDDVFIGPSVVFTNVLNPRSFINRKNEFLSTIIRKGASIGANATIICGCVIGEYALVGAGTLVSRNVAPYALVVGNPAKAVGWISRRGNRLSFNKEGIAICKESGEMYRLTDNEVTLKTAS